MSSQKEKIIVILGPTASGKSDLAVAIALRLSSGQAKRIYGISGAEIISADSRQIYRKMDIGTGKVPISYERSELTKSSIPPKGGIQMFYRGIRHHLLDVADPKKRFSVAEYKKLAKKAIQDIHKRGKIPIICGGTGFYIDAITNNIQIPEVKPDWKLRAKLEKEPTEKLFGMLQFKDPERAKNIDPNNRRRLIRALEIVYKTGKPVPPNPPAPLSKGGFKENTSLSKGNFAKFTSLEKWGGRELNILYIGIQKSPEELKKLISRRLQKRFKQGMIKEVENLHKTGVSWKRLEEFGLEYRWIAYFLQDKISRKEMILRLQKEIEHYAKRQMTWFKRNQKIKWAANQKNAEKEIKEFLND